jgi:hypothetical protein
MGSSKLDQPEWFAARVLQWQEQDVVVQLGVPYQNLEGERWICRYMCSHAEQDVVRMFQGNDSMHALFVALIAVGKYLDEHFPGASWDGTGHTGFPKWIPLIFIGTKDQQEFEALIELQIEERFRHLEKVREE